MKRNARDGAALHRAGHRHADVAFPVACTGAYASAAPPQQRSVAPCLPGNAMPEDGHGQCRASSRCCICSGTLNV